MKTKSLVEMLLYIIFSWFLYQRVIVNKTFFLVIISWLINILLTSGLTNLLLFI